MDEIKNINELSPEEMEGVTGGKNQKVIATKAGVSIYDQPGKENLIVSKTTSGAMANYTGEMQYVQGEAWVRVKWNGKSGWILAKYVKIV